jgi:hypothetical protein
MKTFLLTFIAAIACLHAEPLKIRAIAANLTSDNKQSYSPDNGNHSNDEGAGARILKALKPDIVMIQEFNTTIPARQWVNQTLGEDFNVAREEGMQIPNGVISRFPIVASGSWDDPVLNNREFFWAQVKLPGGKDLWVVSLHLHSKNDASRGTQATALKEYLQRNVPAESMLLIGGDLNTKHDKESCFGVLADRVVIPALPPADEKGIIGTNAGRKSPYDWVLASPNLDKLAVPVKIAGIEFGQGLVFDTRVFTAMEQMAPAKEGDSGLKMMQHMAVVRDFVVP